MKNRNETPSGNYAAHQQAWESLPWYVNGTLTGSELDEVEAHVANCVTCRAEIRTLRQIGQQIHQAGDQLMSPSRGLSALMQRIDEAERGSAGRTRGVLLAWRRTPRPVRVAVVAQAALVVMLTLAALWPARTPSAPQFHTLSDPPAVAVRRAELRLVFTDETTVAELRELLLEVGGEIVAGPTPTGVYTVAVAADAESGGVPETTLAALRSSLAVRYAEVVVR